MIKITVELLPYGSEIGKKNLGIAEISNDATGTKTIGNYNIKLFKWGNSKVVWKKGRVEGFRRLTRGPWDLMYLALKNIVGDRNIVKENKED